MDRNKEAFVVGTPLQLYNVIDIIESESKKNCDLFIVKEFKDSDEVIGRLTECNIFSEIYVTEREEMHSLQRLHILMGLMFPRLYCRREYKLDIKRQYKSVYFSFPKLMFELIIAACSPDRVIGVEDGIGSYFGDIFHEHLSKKFLIYRWITHHSYKIEKLYLRAPEYYSGKDLRLCTLESSPRISTERIKYIFGYTEDRIYAENKTVFLNQPLADFADRHRETEKSVVETVTGVLDNDYVVRLHPRETERDIYSSGIIDNQNNMWEILCGEVISDEHVLIGLFSTAQFFPKYYFKKEPYVIFTLPLYDDILPGDSARYSEMIENLRKAYKNPEKVITAGSLDELARILEKIRNKNVR